MATPTSKPSSVRRTTTKKAAPKKADSPRSSEAHERDDDPSGAPSSRERAPRAQARPRPKAAQVAQLAARELLELTGKQAEGVTGIERTEDGWLIQVEVVETRRIPDTTDILALYEVQADERGGLEGYRRLRRYVRGTPGEN